jgi:acyl-coenzyme A synthetase/AMP-(fatty) acid ligase
MEITSPNCQRSLMANETIPADDQFDLILRSPIPLPPVEEYRYGSFWEMLFSATDEPADELAVLVGATESGPLRVTLADLRIAAIHARQWCDRTGLQRGDTLLAVRLPRTSEVPLAVALIALMAAGIRVVLPMTFGRDTLARMLSATSSRGLLWCAADGPSGKHEEVRHTDQLLRAACRQSNVPSYAIETDLNLTAPLDSIADNVAPARETSREVLVPSTSGSSGEPKLVRYTEHALLTVAQSWQAAGLMDQALTGGSSICPALSHSMGMRNVLHAVWNRRPTLLIQPEWMEEQPKRFVKLLESSPPCHITCGPGLLRDLALLGASVARIRKALSSLRCVVSSGAAAANKDDGLPKDILRGNAFGMTEVQQVLNTLIGPPPREPAALGRPLPGVSVAVRYTEADRQLGRLLVNAPFAGAGYVGQPDFAPWFDTGDLVQRQGDSLVWAGHADEDFLNTGLGLKIAGSDLKQTYAEVEAEVEELLFIETNSASGVVAIGFIGQRDPADRVLHDKLRAAIVNSHARLADSGREFNLRYGALLSVGLVAGSPPRRGPGKTDRQKALSEQDGLIAALVDPANAHPHVIHSPPRYEDIPDWRRFLSPPPTDR